MKKRNAKECCGALLLTPFCPQCGRPNDDPALALVKYLRERAKATGNAAARSGAEETRARAIEFEQWADLVLALSKLEFAKDDE